MTTREDILAYAFRYDGDWMRIGQAIREREPAGPVACSENYVTLLDPEYPPCFRKLRHPPWILFWKGSLALLQRPAVLVTGSRRPALPGVRNTQDITEVLGRRYVIAAGLSAGVETEAHKAALSTGTIAVLAGGLGCFYPASSAWLQRIMSREHLVISEYPPDVSALPGHFGWRARLMCALAQAVIIPEAQWGEGTGHVVDAALELGVQVYCLPAAFSCREASMCNELISQGAQIVPSLQFLRDL